MEPRKTIISETEWWDRAAMAVDLLLERHPHQKRRISSNGLAVEWAGNGSLPSGDRTEAPPQASAYVFQNISSREILRRLTQMPDEIALDFLMEPFVIYCPENQSLVSVNDPSTPLEEHLKNLQGPETSANS